MIHARRIALVLVLLLALLAAAAFGWRAYLIHQLREPVLATLNDPDAALFRSEAYYGPWTGSNGILCGQVNAKNGFGAYTGYRGFDSHHGLAYIESDNPILKACSDLGDPRTIPWWWIRW